MVYNIPVPMHVLVQEFRGKETLQYVVEDHSEILYNTVWVLKIISLSDSNTYTSQALATDGYIYDNFFLFLELGGRLSRHTGCHVRKLLTFSLHTLNSKF